MTNDQVRGKAERYFQMLAKSNVEPMAYDHRSKGPNALQLASHSMWMCCQIPRLMVENKSAQAREWLRFVEGILWSAGVMSFIEMTNDDGTTPSILRVDQ